MEKRKIILNKHLARTGFTLVEMMVSVFIFSLILLASIGAVFAVVSANANNQALQSVSNNLNFALESMVRTIRLGYDYRCGDTNYQNCPLTDEALDSVNDNLELRLRDSASQEARFRLSGNAIQKYYNGQYVDITSPEVQVTRLAFFVDGVGVNQDWPNVIIVVQGQFKYKNRTIPFSVETMATQRRFEESEFIYWGSNIY